MKALLTLLVAATLSSACAAPAAGDAGDAGPAGEQASPALVLSPRAWRLSGDWTVDERMPPEWQEAAVRALDGWSAALGEPAFRSVVVGPVADGQRWTISAVDEAPEGPSAGGQTVGADWTSVVFAAGTVSRERPNADIDRWFSVVVAHELGHVLMDSDRHAEGRDCGVMYKTGSYAVARGIDMPTACDAELYRAVWAADPAGMR